MMSKHQEILDYLKGLAVGKRVSVRGISNRLKVSDGTAYRAIKEAESRGLVETRPRSGTIRIQTKNQLSSDKLTYAKILEVCSADLVAGNAGLEREFSHFAIAAMTLENIGRYLTSSGLLIVGDREDVQIFALEHGNAILVTGGFEVSDKAKAIANRLSIPIMISHFDTFTVARMINSALSDIRIKTDLKTVEEILIPKFEADYLFETDTVRDFHQLVRKLNQVRFPVLNQHEMVVGMISMRDVTGKEASVTLDKLMTRNPIVTYFDVSLASVSQKMLLDDFQMLPVVANDGKLLGVVTRRKVMAELKNLQEKSLPTFSEEIVSHLKVDDASTHFSFTITPSMVDSTGNLSQGILTEYLKEITIRVLTKKQQKNVIIEQMMLYFLQAVQIDDDLQIYPKVIARTRKNATLDFEIYQGRQIVFKAIVTTKLN